MFFNDRHDAGNQLASRLLAYKGKKDAVVLGLARGGVVVANALARALSLPLSVVVVRKIGAPGNAELSLGAVTDSGEAIYNHYLVQALGVSSEYLKRVTEQEALRAKTRAKIYFTHLSPPSLKDKIAILVDDGIATGASMRAAIHAIKKQGVCKVVLAVPVAAPDSLAELSKEVEEVVCLHAPSFFGAVGAFYREFTQCTDEEVIELL